ncbi:Ovalbumin-related protein Y, partial [Stegodyphus mimosarum]
MFRILSVWLVTWVLVSSRYLASEAQIRPLTFAMRKLAFSTNQFGIDLYRALKVPKNEVVAFCPFCISTSLAMILLGAQGRSANALQQALYLWGVRQEDVHIAFHDLLIHLRDNLQVTPGHHIPDHLGNGNGGYRQEYGVQDFEILLFNSIYVQREYSILYHYQKFLHTFYNTSVHPLDFSMYGEESRLHINAIVEKQTKGNIKNILDQPLPKTTSVLLLNALSFDGVLDISGSTTNPTAEDVHRNSQYNQFSQGYNNHPFSLNHAFQPTHSRLPPIGGPGSYYAPSFSQAMTYAAATPYNTHNFITPPTRTRQGGLRHGIYDYLGCTGVEVPFRSGLLSLVLLIPSDTSSINMLETRLNAQHITDILGTMQSKNVILEIPHISFEDSPKNLTQALFRSGLVDLFTPGFAELLGMSDFRWLHITNLIHKINVNIKNGNNVNHQQTAPPSGQETIHMSLQDKPFLFFVIDNISGLAL